jgi:hypothetical protein
MKNVKKLTYIAVVLMASTTLSTTVSAMGLLVAMGPSVAPSIVTSITTITEKQPSYISRKNSSPIKYVNKNRHVYAALHKCASHAINFVDNLLIISGNPMFCATCAPFEMMGCSIRIVTRSSRNPRIRDIMKLSDTRGLISLEASACIL